MEQILCKKWSARGELVDSHNCRLRKEHAFDKGWMLCEDCPVFKSESTKTESAPETDWRIDLMADIADRAGYPIHEIAGALKVSEDQALEMIERSRLRWAKPLGEEAVCG